MLPPQLGKCHKCNAFYINKCHPPVKNVNVNGFNKKPISGDSDLLSLFENHGDPLNHSVRHSKAARELSQKDSRAASFSLLSLLFLLNIKHNSNSFRTFAVIITL